MLELIFFAVILPIAALIIGIIIGLFFKGLDRRFAAYYQSRIGPPIRQPFYDISKLMNKQNIVPENAVKWLFNGAPLVALASSVILLLYIWAPAFTSIVGLQPFFVNLGDIILLLYLLMIPSVAMIVGGFASGSPYATVGAQREMVILISTELPLAIAAITFGWVMSQTTDGISAFSINTFAAYPIWNVLGPLGIIGGILILFTMLVVTPAELAKIPFDQAEAETEIAEGLLAEYSGRNLAFFHIAEAIKSLAFTSIVVILFIPYGFKEIFGTQAIISGIDFTAVINIIFFFIKLFVIYFISIITVRIGMARFKINQVAKIFLISLTLIGIAGYILIALDPTLLGGI